jgi:hypothetical protein
VCVCGEGGGAARPGQQTGNFQTDTLEYGPLTKGTVQHKKRGPTSSVTVLYATVSVTILYATVTVLYSTVTVLYATVTVLYATVTVLYSNVSHYSRKLHFFYKISVTFKTEEQSIWTVRSESRQHTRRLNGAIMN